MDQGMQAVCRSWGKPESGFFPRASGRSKSPLQLRGTQDGTQWKEKRSQDRGESSTRSGVHSASIYPRCSDAGPAAVEETDINSCLRADIPVGKTYNQQSSKMHNTMASSLIKHEADCWRDRVIMEGFL